MAYTEPSADDLQVRFPRFADVADATIEVHLTEARRSVDASWCEDDRALGEMLLAAHTMTLEGLGSGTEAELAAEGMGDIRSLRSGSLQFTKSEAAMGSAAGEIGSTTYGRRYLELLRSNRGGARVTNTGSFPDVPPYQQRFY